MESLEDYLEALASAAPTPGGGSAATIVGAMGAALVAMVARITVGNPKFADCAREAERIIVEADRLRGDLLEAREIDERAYGSVVSAMSLPRATEAEKRNRSELLQTALARAAHAPLQAADLALRVLDLAQRGRLLGNTNLMSDIVCAAAFAQAAIDASAANVRVNHAFLKDASLVAEQERELTRIENAASTTRFALRSA